MTLIYTLYFALSFGILAAMAVMILRIGKAIGNCPQTQTAARAASVTITSGYLTIGAGGVFLVASLLPIIKQSDFTSLMLSLGVVCVALGLGFSNAIVTLRAAVRPAQTLAHSGAREKASAKSGQPA